MRGMAVKQEERRSTGRGSIKRKCWRNHSVKISPSIHPLLELSPQIVSGTFPGTMGIFPH